MKSLLQLDGAQEFLLDIPNVQVLKDGHAVARSSDFMMYAVEAEFIGRVVEEYGPCKQMPHRAYTNTTLISSCSSNQNWFNRCRSDFCQSTGEGGF